MNRHIQLCRRGFRGYFTDTGRDTGCGLESLKLVDYAAA